MASTCTVRDLMAAVERIAPAALAADWDPVGLQVGRPGAPVRRVMTCLELTPPTLAEAVRRRADAVVAHHPLLFKPLGKLDLGGNPGRLIEGLVLHGISLIAAHTNLDAAAWSTGHVLAERLGLTVEGHLTPPAVGEVGGLGVIARPRRPVAPATFIEVARKAIPASHPRISGPIRKPVRRVAIVTGSGGSMLREAATAADLFITGEINYHHAVEAHALGLAVLELGHFETEVIVAAPLAERLAQDCKLQAAGVKCFPAKRDLQPFHYPA